MNARDHINRHSTALNTGMCVGIFGFIIALALLRFLGLAYLPLVWSLFALAVVFNLIGWYTMRCPQCNGKLLPTNAVADLRIQDRVKFCVYCGFRLDTEMDN